MQLDRDAPWKIATLRVLLKSLAEQVPRELSQKPAFQQLVATLGELSSKEQARLYQSFLASEDTMSQLKKVVAEHYKRYFDQARTNEVSQALGQAHGRLYERAVFVFWVNTLVLGKHFKNFRDFLAKERAKACDICYAYAKLGASPDEFLRAYFSKDFEDAALPATELRALWGNYWKECEKKTPDGFRSKWLLDRALHQESDLA